MCGRFVRICSIDDIAQNFRIQYRETDLDPNYNIAPKQPIVVIMEEGKKKLVSMRWGLIPKWAKDEKISNSLINARAETIDEKPSFKDPFIHKRCIIVADGFYEWITKGSNKIPVYIYLESQQTFGMAGIYDRWISPQGTIISTCAIITTESNEFMKKIHHRMPVILAPELFDRWINPDITDIQQLKKIMNPRVSHPLNFHEVSPKMNSPLYNRKDCIEPT